MDFEALKQMAMADGILTNNEKTLFRQYLDLSDVEAEKLFRVIEEELKSVQSETEIIDWKHKNGLDFEKHVVGLLHPNYYSIIDWTGDKYCNGLYDLKNHNPDITVKVNLAHLDVRFAIECKWRMSFYNGTIYIASEKQLNRYFEFQRVTGIPVFFVLGVGGSGKKPDDIFVFPLHKIKYPVAKLEYILCYKKTDSQLYFDVKTEILR